MNHSAKIQLRLSPCAQQNEGNVFPFSQTIAKAYARCAEEIIVVSAKRHKIRFKKKNRNIKKNGKACSGSQKKNGGAEQSPWNRSRTLELIRNTLTAGKLQAISGFLRPF